MDDIDHEDPFAWDVAAVSKELCALGRPWTRDPVDLARRIYEEEIDGKTLLIYELTFSRKELVESLGIRVARQKAALIEHIVNLQAKSPGFLSWKREFLNEKSTDDLPIAEPHPTVFREPPSNLQAGVKRARSQDAADPYIHGAGFLPIIAASVENPPTPARSNSAGPPNQERGGSGDVERLLQHDRNDPLQTDVAPVDSSRLEEKEELESIERPPKKRRIAPIHLPSHPATHAAPAVSGLQPRTTDAHDPDSYTYLGAARLDMAALMSPAASADERMIELADGSFAAAKTSRTVLPGLRMVIAQAMKTRLRKNARREALAKQGMVAMRSPTHSDADEDVLDMDDLPEDWDEETRMEMAEEQAEIAARDRELAQFLPQERVEAILQEVLETMKSKWKEKKLPRYERRAWKLWTDARRRERIKRMVFDAQRMAETCDGRIKKLLQEILKDKWQKEDQVRNQAKIIEQNIDDKLYNLWLIGLLESRVEPEKPDVIPRPRAAPRSRKMSNDDEVLTSDDELDGFIVADEMPLDTLPLDTPLTPKRSHSKEEEVPFVLDLTQVETPDKSSNGRSAAEYIDLTASPKDADGSSLFRKKDRWRATDDDLSDEPPPLDRLESVETIGKLTTKYWVNQRDRWRLVICMIFRLAHARRQAILHLLQDKSSDEVWDASVKLQLSNPITEDERLQDVEASRVVASDLTRIFICFTRCRLMNERAMANLGKKEKKRLNRVKDLLFPKLCAFIRQMAPLFPKDNQIIRIETPSDVDEEVARPDGMSDRDEPSSGRKRPRREIVQDREAVDLRERELQRIKEQEARRRKLRTALANSHSIASDKSRLIINESKQEDQALIYVNEDIGRRIKDHQITGVRFLWNQVIRDVDVRQGCLLAHTMGLGKTMQVITFLVSIREASASSDPSVRNQIPQDLQASQTLVLCPAGLVDNWVDEVLLWAPKGLLGDVRKLESSMSPSHRTSTVEDWARRGGLLIIGYDMFKRTFANGDDTSLLEKMLIETPTIVIADEAHTLKNPSAKISQICSRFRTHCRIALTGTPLANNVEEYYAMINWVAPNFLGPRKEFNELYVNRIQQGLWSDSTPYEQNQAIHWMEVLKRTVAPKIDRATISCIKEDLPFKHEFVLFVRPTPLQKRLYDLYMTKMLEDSVTQVRIFGILNDLTLICNHPRCFRKEAQDVRQKGIESRELVGTSLTEKVLSATLRETNVKDLDDPGYSQKVQLLLLILDEARRDKEKVLVFSQSIPTLDYLENLLKMQKRLICRLDGGTRVSSRQEMVKSFNFGDKEVYLISTRAGGMGLNIQGANRVVIFDIKWNPTVDQQAIGRAYRIGQQKPVFVYHLLVAGTFEEVLHNKAVFKMQLANRVVDKKNPISWGKRNGVLEMLKPVPCHDLSPFLHRDGILNKLIEHSARGGPDGVIRRILSSDAFEEEDPNVQVTAEMNAQIEEIMRMEAIRRADPERYQRMMADEQVAALATPRAYPEARPMQGLMPMGIQGSGTFYQGSISNVGGMDGTNDGPYSPAHLEASGLVLASQANPHANPHANLHSPYANPVAPILAPPMLAAPSPHYGPAATTSVMAAPLLAIAPAPAPAQQISLTPAATNSAVQFAPLRPQTIPRALRPSAAIPAASAATSVAPPTTAQHIPVPPPIPGANTYFKEPELAAASPSPTGWEPPSMSATKKGGIFGTPHSQAKAEFEANLARVSREHRDSGLSGSAQSFARDIEAISASIARALKERSQGFLYDNARWALLSKLLVNNRFVSAMVSGLLRPDFLALAKPEEVERRAALLSSFSAQEMMEQRHRVTRPDPNNLGNILKATPLSARAREDLEVMMQTADKRRQRGVRLPEWANEALAQSPSEGAV